MNSVQHLAQLLQQSQDGPAPALVAYLEVRNSTNTDTDTDNSTLGDFTF